MKLINEDKGFEPAPMGLHKAVCVDIVDLGMLEGFAGKMQHKINFVFEIADAMMEDRRPFLVFRRFTATLAETGHLAPFLAKWRGGVAIAQKEEVDLDQFVNKPALLVIAHAQDNGKTYANIDAILPCAEPVRPSGHYKRKEPKQSGSAASKPVPQQAQLSGTSVSRTAPPLPSSNVPLPSGPLPKTEELYREGALGITGKVATQEQKEKFLGLLKQFKDTAAAYFNSIGALGNDQPLEELPLQYCPTSKSQYENVMKSMESWSESREKTTPAEDDVPF